MVIPSATQRVRVVFVLVVEGAEFEGAEALDVPEMEVLVANEVEPVAAVGFAGRWRVERGLFGIAPGPAGVDEDSAV